MTMSCKPTVNRTRKVVPEGGFEPPTRGFSILLKAPFSAAFITNCLKNQPIGINSLQKACKPK